MDSEDKLNEILKHAEMELRNCPYCIQHNKEFVARYPRVKKGRPNVFSSSLAFKDSGMWYHLQLCAPQSNSRGGYNWQECSQYEHHEYIAIVTGHIRTLQDAIDNLELQ